MIERLYKDEKGFTTLGVVIALALSLSLIFSSAQVYRVNSVSAAIQDVADAAALAAENEVAEFVLAAQVADAVVLSLSLASYVSTGAGVVCMCVPPAQGVGNALLQAGRTLASSRDSFSRAAVQGLNAAQRALPFIAAAKAASVAQANAAHFSGANYSALAILFPLVGEELEVPHIDDSSLFDQVDAEKDQLEETAGKAEEAAAQAAQAKQDGFMADCGNDPDGCLYERVGSLAPGSGYNPMYRSVDAWSFSVALNRACAYYQERFEQERPQGSSVEECAKSALRANYYRFACAEIQRGYVYETDDSFEAYFPLMPKNTSEMRRTSLYTEAVYPVSSGKTGLIMHAYAGCPGAAGASGVGSVSQMEAGGYETCPQCGFTAASLGQVGSATSSTQSGFEYHYRLVAQAAEQYEKARQEAEPLRDEARQQAKGLLESVKDAIGLVKDCRIKVSPPGSQGAVALVIDPSQVSPAQGFESSFVQTSSTLGARAALAGATLLPDKSTDGSTILNTALTGVTEKLGAEMGASQAVLSCWSSLLSAYGTGHDALVSGLEEVLNDIPLLGLTGLGTWAANTLRDMLESAGLQPAKLDALKPVIVNTSHLGEEGGDSFSAGFARIRAGANDALSAYQGVASWAEGALESQQRGESLVGDSLEIAVIAPLGSEGPSVVLALPLPRGVQSAIDQALYTLAGCFSASPLGGGGRSTWQ